MKKLTLLFLLLIAMGCEVNDGIEARCGKEFHILAVEVLNKESKTVFLNRFKVVDVITNEELTLNEGIPTYLDLMTGIYPLVDDSQKEKVGRKSLLRVLFTGYIDEKEVCSREFSIGNDGCHLYIEEGDTELVID